MQQSQANNPGGGGRVASLNYGHSMHQLPDFTRLETTTRRYELLLLVKRVGKQGGLTPRMIQLLDYYMAFTTEADWEAGSRPVVFQSLARTALDLGVGERQIQKLEKRLFEIGAITWHDSGNHKRFGRRDPKTGKLLFAYGVDLTPLAYLKKELEAKLAEKLRYNEQWQVTKRAISECRRQLRGHLLAWSAQGDDTVELGRYEQRLQSIAIQVRSHIELEALQELLRQHQGLLNDLIRAMGGGEVRAEAQGLVNAPSSSQEGSCRSEQRFAHKENTIPIQKLNKGSPGDDLQRRHARSHDWQSDKAIGKQTLQAVVRGATDQFRAHLLSSGIPRTWHDVVEAAYQRRAELRIGQESWAEACTLLGRTGAAVCLVLTDRAAVRADRPALYPGRYFRALAQRCRAGELQLASLHG